MHGLDSKIDLPIKVMREYYTRSKENTSPMTVKNIRKIAKYCIVNSLSCQSLMVKRNIINDYREVASIAYVSLFDSHYYAGGMKVYNLLGAEAWKRDILITMIPSERTEKGTFSGAYVFPPDKGLENKRPVTGLDFASLYPSIIMNYNLLQETMTLLAEEAGVLEKAGEILYKIEFPFNGRILHAWSIRHENKNNKMGLYPSVLKELLNKRNKTKAQLGILSNRKEYMELVISKIKERNLSVADAIDHILKNAEDKEKRANMNEILIPLINETYKNFKIEYNSICFDHTCLDSKQKAVKIYMNTFYGEAGNSLSPFFFLQLAGGITSAGQHNIKLVAEYVTKKKGFGIKYGDTDSLYLTCPIECYKECDLAYNNSKGTISKLEYWTEMVNIIMKVIEKLCNDVNTYLKIKNRSTYLKMAYKEVLFPVVFTGKKKYFGIPHKKVPNFNPKELFIKGIDTVKQDNKRVQRFIGRMREKYQSKIPDPGIALVM
ncbi:DNA polymerase family B-domain-containing protein [Gigaspora rosea]|uniref:DNA-directed DNA polymerase n=1 Tax=Gigaspora rosea TaxID=44941 RepID=A0A397W472_9GLOM|nr:DNA polymerase family B-domain-containing protein [Gigaspora rosea]